MRVGNSSDEGQQSQQHDNQQQPTPYLESTETPIAEEENSSASSSPINQQQQPQQQPTDVNHHPAQVPQTTPPVTVAAAAAAAAAAVAVVTALATVDVVEESDAFHQQDRTQQQQQQQNMMEEQKDRTRYTSSSSTSSNISTTSSSTSITKGICTNINAPSTTTIRPTNATATTTQNANPNTSTLQSLVDPKLQSQNISPNIHYIKNSNKFNQFQFNDALLIQDRRFKLDHRMRRNLELMSESKISKNSELEEIHFSMPSSIRSTFIMTFSPDGHRVASTHNDHRIYICDLQTGKLLDTLEGHPKTPWCLAWHPINKEILASGCLAGEVRVWDLRSKACESWTSENNSIISSLDFHPKERILVIATSNDIHFWDWSETEPFAKTTTTHDKEKIKFVEFDSSGTKLITGISNLPKYASNFNGNTNVSSGISSNNTSNTGNNSNYNVVGDSLQNRIIDSYLTQGSLDQLPSVTTENMTQNSEITSNHILHHHHPLHHINHHNQLNLNQNQNNNPGTLLHDGNINFNDRNTSSNQIRNLSYNNHLVIAGSSNGNPETDSSYRSTLTLSRIALLYRQLEALEDSMRHTSFSPYVSPRHIVSSVDSNLGSANIFGAANQDITMQIDSNRQSSTGTTNVDSVAIELQSTNSSSDQQGIDHVKSSENIGDSREAISNNEATPSATTSSTSSTNNNTSSDLTVPSEPFVVSFDESLEQLQLQSLIIGEETINPSTVVEQYPVNLPRHLHYMMQSDSIGQVNQTFIRISKLMSSVRLYRQVVQQILAGNSGQGHFQPNQILTAQSVRSGRHSSNMPVVVPIVNSMGNLDREGSTNRTTDPIMAIQFRNSARNVPLVTLCKIALLSARTVCIMRSQQLIEQAFTSIRSSDDGSASSEQQPIQSQAVNQMLSPALAQLYESLSTVNHAPLTTSNVHTHLTTLRSRVNGLLSALTSLCQTQDGGRRLIDLIYSIAHSLTGRNWNMPLGATLDDIRLDVIHTLCVVDLVLHLARQIQLLQMQRLSAIVRVEESMRLSSSTNYVNDSGNANNQEIANDRLSTNASATTSTITTTTTTTSGYRDGPQTTTSTNRSHGLDGFAKSVNVESENTNSNKRKHSTASTSSVSHTCDASKKIRLGSTENQSDNRNNLTNDLSTPMIETNNTNNNIGNANILPANLNQAMINEQQANIDTSDLLHTADRLVLWNSPTNQSSAEQSLQRLLVASASSMSNGHILVRIHSRNANSLIPPNIIEQSLMDRSISASATIGQSNHESRRRALSQDNNLNSPDLESNQVRATTQRDSELSHTQQNRHHQSRLRQVHVYPSSSLGGTSTLGFASFERQPHLHVYQTRGSGQHLWFNQWTIPLPVSNSNYRLQCWNFSLSSIPNIRDSQANLITQKCRIHNDSSIDISSNGFLVACLVPRDDSACIHNFDLKIFSLKTHDFGSCYYQLRQSSNAISLSISPSASYIVVGLASNKFVSNDPNEDELSIGRVYKLSDKLVKHVRDIKIKKDDAILSLNAIKWLSRGLVYNVGPQHHQRYQAGRMRSRNI